MSVNHAKLSTGLSVLTGLSQNMIEAIDFAYIGSQGLPGRTVISGSKPGVSWPSR